jgi:dihydrolipoamide dehydrogenase
MPTQITMPQLSDTMSEGTLVKWHKKEGDKVKAGDEIADVETDKATMPMEAFDSGVLAHVAVAEGQKVKVGELLAVIATAGEKPEEIKKQFASGKSQVSATATKAAPGAGAAQPAQGSSKAAGGSKSAASATAPGSSAAPAKPPPPTSVPVVQKPTAAAATPSAASTSSSQRPAHYDFDLIVIGGGPAGYAAAIRAGQLKKRVLCIEKENLGGTCLNWGCIPTKALLEDGSFIRKLRTDSAEHGVAFENLKIDFPRIIGRSRKIAAKLAGGIGHLFRKYEVKHEMGIGQLLAPHRVKFTGKDDSREYTAGHVIIAVGARSTPLPGAAFDGKTIITSREAMTLTTQPKRMAIIGAGAIGCEFADFYNAVGTEVTLIEMLPNLLPNEDDDVSLLLKRSFEKRGIKVHLKTRTEKVEKIKDGVRLTIAPVGEGGQGSAASTLDADVVLVAIGVMGNVEDVAAPEAKLELFKSRVKVDHEYRTNLENVWSVGDCISLHWPEHMSMGGYRHPDLAHVAHHEAVNCVEHIFGVSDHTLDYKHIPGCTYTHPQVASMGYTERKARDEGKKIRIGKFPFSASGRALAAGEPEGFVKLIFDEQYGELLGVHMIGENVTDLLAELVLARKLEATEAEIIEAIHPHPTYSEAIMEAAGVADGRAIHL